MMPLAAFWPPDGNPTPATPAGSWNPTWTDDVVTTCSCAGLLTEQPWPRSCCVAALAALKSGQASAAPCTMLPPLSRATIACVAEDAGRCHGPPKVAGAD